MPGDLEHLRRVERAAAQHDLARQHAVDPPAPVGVLDADRLRPVEEDARHERARLDVEVRPLHDRVQVGPSSGEPAAAVDVAVEGREALLAVAVHVVGKRVAGLPHGLEERLEQLARRRPALEHERPVAAPELVRAGEARLHLLEVRQAVGVGPRLHPRLARPALVVHRVPALEDHPVDRARPAEHLAAGVVDPAPAHRGLRLRLVLPVVEPVPDREHQARGHVDVDVPRVVGPPRLEHEHPVRAILAQPVGEDAAGGASTDDDEVVVRIGHPEHLPGVRRRMLHPRRFGPGPASARRRLGRAEAA